MAEGNLELVIARLPHFEGVTLRGPVTQASVMECPRDGEWLAIRFTPGTHFPRLPNASLLDHRDIDLPVLGGRHFWFAELLWEIPTYENAEDLVERLARCGLLARECVVNAALEGDVRWMSQRSAQRHFRRATGLTLGTFQMIHRARHAARLLGSGRSILDATYEAGYFDQAHMTRSLKQLIGITPARLVREAPQLSFSYKTELP
jgi:hypothetical protein